MLWAKRQISSAGPLTIPRKHAAIFTVTPRPLGYQLAQEQERRLSLGLAPFTFTLSAWVAALGLQGPVLFLMVYQEIKRTLKATKG